MSLTAAIDIRTNYIDFITLFTSRICHCRVHNSIYNKNDKQYRRVEDEKK